MCQRCAISWNSSWTNQSSTMFTLLHSNDYTFLTFGSTRWVCSPNLTCYSGSQFLIFTLSSSTASLQASAPEVTSFLSKVFIRHFKVPNLPLTWAFLTFTCSLSQFQFLGPVIESRRKIKQFKALCINILFLPWQYPTEKWAFTFFVSVSLHTLEPTFGS